jgi:hypothetical protein
VLDEIIAHEMGAADIEGTEFRSRRLTLRAENATWLYLFGLTEKLHENGHTLDLSRPPKAGFP